MRKSQMRAGEQYEMQRGPTKRPRVVTLLGLDAPSGNSHRVLVRIDEGIGKGREIEAPSQSIFSLQKHGIEQSPTSTPRLDPSFANAPIGWKPVEGRLVGWSRVGGGRFRVLRVDGFRRIAQIKGEVLGVVKEYDAPFTDLAPFREPRLSVVEDDLQQRLTDRLPVSPPTAERDETSPILTQVDDDRDWINELLFSPKCLHFYRRRFAKGASLAEAEERLRKELRGAAKVRLKRRKDEYLRLRVPGRFDAILKESPTTGSENAGYIDGLSLPRRLRAA
jgi:hypothetical protein